MSLHAYACDCATHHLFNPYGTDCLQNKADEDMMHQVAADDSLTSKFGSEAPTLQPLGLVNSQR